MNDKEHEEVNTSSDQADVQCNPDGSAVTDFYVRSLKTDKKNKGKKGHQKSSLQSGSDKNKKSKKKKTVLEKCQCLEGTDIQFQCLVHDEFICVNCSVGSHKSCKITKIQDNLAEFVESQRLRKVLQQADQFEVNAQLCKKSIEADIKKVENIASKAAEDFEKFKKDVIDYLDKQGEKIKKEIKHLHRENKLQLQTLYGECTTFQEKTKDAKSKLEDEDAETFNKFVQANLAEKLFEKMQTALKSVHSNRRVKYYSFIPNDALREALAKPSCAGQINNSSILGRKVIVQKDICVATTYDNVQSCITGCTLLEPDTLIITDSTNKAVKTVNVKADLVLGFLALKTMVVDVTVVSREIIAVTLPDKNIIQFLKVRKQITQDQSIKVSGACHGIHCHDNKLFVSFPTEKPPKLDILNFKGQALGTFSIGPDGLSLFKWPQYVTVVSSYIFVSDSTGQHIVKLSMAGEVIFRYFDDELGGPNGITSTDDGYILVCCNNAGRLNIQVINTDGSKVGILLDEKEGLKQPFCLEYCQTNRTLYVCSKHNTTGQGCVQKITFSNP